MQKITRRHSFHALSLALALAGLASLASPARAEPGDASGFLAGMVFTSSNSSAGNELLAYSRNTDGSLMLQSSVPTGGLGSSAGLGSQGAVTLSGDGHYAFVVNALSNTVSTFAVKAHSLVLASVVPSGGLHPISVTEHDGTVYVLNDQGDGNVAGFRNVAGQLKPLIGSSRPLSMAGGTGPAQVGFSQNGDTVVVTEKATNRLVSYKVRLDGLLGAPVVMPSPGMTPFGFAFNRNNRLIVSEAVGGAPGASTVSSYRVSVATPAKLVPVSVSVPDTQGAACWVATTPDGRWAYVANTGSSSVSSYAIAPSGKIELAQAVAGQTGAGSAPADTAVSFDGRHLYVRNGGSLSLSSFEIAADGSLTALPATPGLPTTAVGLAAN